VETHLALGNLFRRRGEVDRAIRIHQNLIARPTLSKEHRAQALLELGQDYLRAGLLDRAEHLFQELADSKLHQDRALQNLLIIYERLKEWDKCLDVAARLDSLSGEGRYVERAQYYCELAERAYRSRDYALATQTAKRAQNKDRNCVRATMLLGQLDMERGDCKAAIRNFQQVGQQDPDYLSDVLPSIKACYDRLEDRKGLRSYLEKLLKQHSSVAVALMLTDLIQEQEGDTEAVAFITSFLQENPSLDGLERLLSFSLREAVPTGETLLTLRQLLSRLLQERPAYQCSKCGFNAKTMHWQCPGCHTWGSVKPVRAEAGNKRVQEMV
jgi:lipopolysaccharide biosynthesis regulator YciM